MSTVVDSADQGYQIHVGSGQRQVLINPESSQRQVVYGQPQRQVLLPQNSLGMPILGGLGMLGSIPPHMIPPPPKHRHDDDDDERYESPVEERHQYYKTRICQPWQEGKCNKGSNCTYAHGDHQLRKNVDTKPKKRNDDEPSSKRKRASKNSQKKESSGYNNTPQPQFNMLPQPFGLPAGLNPFAGMAGLNPSSLGLAPINPALTAAFSNTTGLPYMQGLPNYPPLGINQIPPNAPSLPPNAPQGAPSRSRSAGVAGPQRRHNGPYKSKQFVFTSHHDGNGIIFFLGLDRKEGKWYNPVESKSLRVVASSLESGTLAMTVDQEFNDLLFQTKEEYPSWVVFDFLERSVRPTYYSLAHKGILESYMRSWKFEGSNDTQIWDTLCLHTNDVSLGRSSTVASWAVTTGRFYRYLRIWLQQNGNSDHGSALLFNAFEVYGELQLPSI